MTNRGATMINIYCDESCHLPNDQQDVMVLGAIVCNSEKKDTINKDIRRIKEKHGLSTYYEIKWVKVSNSKLEFFLDLVDYFFDNNNLNFRANIASQKNKLNHEKYNKNSHDTWYYKMYYYLLNPLVGNETTYRIFLDIKDTIGSEKVNELHRILNKTKNYSIKDIRLVDSKAIDLLQLSDLLIGALSYYNRGLDTREGSSDAKKAIIQRIKDRSGISLKKSTSLFESKMNIFLWTPRED